MLPSTMLQRSSIFALVAVLAFRSDAWAADFDHEIRPMLQKHCQACHGVNKQKGELRLDTRAFAFKGGNDGPAVVAGNAEASPLFQRITSNDKDERMPPEGDALTPAQITLIREWIDSGAKWPEKDADRAAADNRLQHWSVQPVKVDSVLADSLGLKPELLSIDTFIKVSLSAKGLAMSPEPDRRTLIRRLAFDLVGLPPTSERVEQFARDPDPNAYENLVDELLKSPHYGERWARHWLDIAHYADTHGFERDQLRPNAWRYRDYVIESLNADKPYDLFIREQIAGDFIAPNDVEAVTATGFLAAGPWDFVGQVETKSELLKRAARAGDLDDMVTQVITSTMGITINCARCHDHKLDPITQQEYYSLWSVFAGVKRGEREVSATESEGLATEKSRIEKALARTRTQIAKLAGDGLELAALIPKESGIDLRNGLVTKDKQAYHSDIQTNRLQKVENVPGVKWVFIPDGINSDLLFIGDPKLVPVVTETRSTEAEAVELKRLRAEAQKLESDLKALPEPPKVYAVVSDEKPPVVKMQRRGNPEDEGEEVVPAAFAWANHAPVALGDNATPEGQRRRALAEWITHPDNPLTRRVLVNRLWHHHFGQGLVTTPSDFGLGGDKPSHPELLDWLASQFLKSGWSIKHMHKLIVMSAAYRQHSRPANGEAARLDAENRFLWRQNPRRLDAESLHDAILLISGTLNPARSGPGYRDFKYTEAYAPLYDYFAPDQPELWRRSIYRFIVRTTPHQFMSTLDCPDPANLTPARVHTTTALQALTLSNNNFILQQVQHLVTRIEKETDSRESAIRRAFALTFQREATAAELEAATPIVTEHGLFALCRVLINANEFVYLD